MTSIILHCANCRKRLPDDSKFCPYCGWPAGDALVNHYKDDPTEQSAAARGASTGWQLMLVRPDGEQMVSELVDGLSIGRSPKNTMQLDDQKVSRFHARIEKGEAGFEIRDLDSMNGTTLNRKPVTGSLVLKVGDVITIGDHRLLVQHKTSRCSNCRREVSADHLFCRNCGEPLTGVKNAQSPADSGEEGTQPLP